MQVSMRPLQLITILTTTVAVFCSLYAPQPIQRVLAAHFGVGLQTASLFITVTLLPLSIAPLAYGLLLERVQARRMLMASVLGLSLATAALAFCDGLRPFLILRLAQGLLIPAALTGLMTYVATHSRPDSVQRSMAFYVAATIFGGFFGRFLSGLLTTAFGWRAPFGMIGLTLAVCFVLLLSLDPDARARFERIRPNALPEILRRPAFLRVYLIIFCCFFVYTGLLNFLPHRLASLDSGISELRIGAAYLGYLMGIVVALTSRRICRALGGERNAMIAGLALHMAATALFTLPWLTAAFLSMFPFCAGMFLVHALAPGLLNSLSGQNRGLVNGLYIAFYYTGGTLGSFLPGLVYTRFGWTALVALLCGMLGLALLLARGLRLAPREQTAPASEGQRKPQPAHKTN